MVAAVVCDRPGCHETVKEIDTYFVIHSNKTTRINGFHLCNRCMLRAMEAIVK